MKKSAINLLQEMEQVFCLAKLNRVAWFEFLKPYLGPRFSFYEDGIFDK